MRDSAGNCEIKHAHSCKPKALKTQIELQVNDSGNHSILVKHKDRIDMIIQRIRMNDGSRQKEIKPWRCWQTGETNQLRITFQTIWRFEEQKKSCWRHGENRTKQVFEGLS